MQMQFRPAIKSAMAWGGSGAFGGGWGRFEKLQDPWPRSRPDTALTGAESAYLNSVVATCIAWMQRAFPEPVLRVWTHDGDEVVDDHPLTLLFRRPNKFYGGSRIWQCVLRDWVLTGNAYLRKERSNGGQVIGLHYLPQTQMKPDWPKGAKSTVYVSNYIYTVGGEPEDIDVDDVIHFRFGQDPDNARLGWSPLRAGLRELTVLNTGADYRSTLLENMGTPPYVAQPKDPLRVVTEEIAERFRGLWARLTGGRNRGSLMMPTVPMEFERIGFSPAELDIISMLGWDAEVVCSLLGLSAMVVNLPSNSKTYSNYEESYKAALRHNLIPTQKLFAEELDIQLLDDMGDPLREYVMWDYSKVQALQEDENKLWRRVTEAQKAGILTVNEARDRLDATLPEIEEPLPVPPGSPESTGDAAALAEGASPPASMNGAGITAERFKSLAGVFGE